MDKIKQTDNAGVNNLEQPDKAGVNNLEQPDNTGVNKRAQPDSPFDIFSTKRHLPGEIAMQVNVDHPHGSEILLVIMKKDAPVPLWTYVYEQVSDVDVNSYDPKMFYTVCKLCVFAIFADASSVLTEIARDNDICVDDLDGSFESRCSLVEELNRKELKTIKGSFEMKTRALFGQSSYRCGGPRPLINWETRVYM